METIESLTNSELPPISAAHIAERMVALSHPARIEILRLLSASGCCCCKDVVGSLHLAQSTVSQHLKILVSAGLVTYAPHRQRSLYEIDREAIESLSEAVSALLESCCAETSICEAQASQRTNK